MFNRNEINPAARPTRTHYPWHALEEFLPDGGMWRTPHTWERAGYIEATQQLMADPGKFHTAMSDAVNQWPRSTSAALTTPGLNYRAWMGHAGCFLATGSPEETTRLGWHELDEGEQYIANAVAGDVIRSWRTDHEPPTLTLIFGGANDA